MRKKRSFSLVEVLVSITLLAICLVPLLQDTLFRVQTYKKIHDELVAMDLLERAFFEELALIGTSTSSSFETLSQGYQREVFRHQKFRIVAQWSVLGSSGQPGAEAFLGRLAVVVKKNASDEANVLLQRSIVMTLSKK